MLLNKRLPSNALVVSLLFVVSTLLFGCSSMKVAEMLNQNNILQQKNNELAAEIAKENAVTADLALKLVEKKKEIDRIKCTQEHLTQEIAHTKAMLPTTLHTKVEVVTYLAEVETEINAAKELASDGKQLIFVQVDRFMAESKIELEQGNYDMAVFRASQAVELTKAIRIKTAINRRMEESTYAEFILPLQLHLVTRSNIRKKPTKRAEILFILASKTPVTAIGYQGDWIKVITTNFAQEGWIHYSLLTAPPISRLIK